MFDKLNKLAKLEQRECDLNDRERELDARSAKVNGMIADCQKLLDSQVMKFVTVKIPKEDEIPSYWNKLCSIYADENFLFFISKQKEEIIMQLSPALVPGKFRFLDNTEQVAGAIKAIEKLLAAMEKIKKDYTDLLEAEQENATN